MKILDVNNMLDAAHDSGMPAVNAHTESVEAAASLLAAQLAQHLGIAFETARYEKGFGGLCACFGPAKEGQPCPEVIHDGDPGGDWEL